MRHPSAPSKCSDLWYIHTAREQDWDWYKDQMESTVPYTNVHTGPRQGQGPGPTVSYCASRIPLYRFGSHSYVG